MQPKLCLCLLVAVVASVTVNYARAQPVVDAREPIPVPASGGRGDISTSDQTVVAMADFALAELGSVWELRGIRRAQVQGVSQGIMFYLKLDVQRVKLFGRNENYECKFQILERSRWQGSNWEVVQFDCTRQY